MSEASIAGYCRACGRALAEADVHRAHGAFYCKEHAPQEGASSSSPYGSSPYSAGPSYSAPYSPQPPGSGNGISPLAAFWLGLIPGVGAIYNGQYLKGFVHVAVIGFGFAILDNNAAGGFDQLVGMMLAVFWAYMPFEAYHTARNRQMGQPVDEFSGLFPRRGANFPAVPVILIGLGTLLLLNNLGLFELRRVLRFWPLLLIGAGVYMLFNRFSMPGSSASVNVTPDAAPAPVSQAPAPLNPDHADSGK
jgi:hypothetical protein